MSSAEQDEQQKPQTQEAPTSSSSWMYDTIKRVVFVIFVLLALRIIFIFAWLAYVYVRRKLWFSKFREQINALKKEGFEPARITVLETLLEELEQAPFLYFLFFNWNAKSELDPKSWLRQAILSESEMEDSMFYKSLISRDHEVHIKLIRDMAEAKLKMAFAQRVLAKPVQDAIQELQSKLESTLEAAANP